MKNRILILDGNRMLSNVIEESLLYVHFDVQIADELLTFFKLYKDFKPDLILIEFYFNGNNKDEIYNRLKNMTSSIPVIIMSANVKAFKSLGNYGRTNFIGMTFNLVELLKYIKEDIEINEVKN